MPLFEMDNLHMVNQSSASDVLMMDNAADRGKRLIGCFHQKTPGRYPMANDRRKPHMCKTPIKRKKWGVCRQQWRQMTLLVANNL
jgi:hypothetical protein